VAQTRIGLLGRRLRKVLGLETPRDRTDDALLQRFAARRDEEAFAALLRRHGPLVLGVCRRVLRHEQDAEDAFQAVFLVLACKAGSIRRGAALGGWLHAVASRIALAARGPAERHRAAAPPAEQPAPDDPQADASRREVRAVLDEELRELPEKYRAALVLCYLQGRTHEEAARELGCPLGSMAWRLERGGELLRRRLVKRGVTLSAGSLMAALAGGPAPEVAAALTARTVRAAVLFAAGSSAAGVVSSPAAALFEGALQTMSATRLKTGVVLALAVLLAVTGASAGVLLGDGQGEKPPPAGPRPAGTVPQERAGAQDRQAAEVLPAGWPLFRGNAGRSAQAKELRASLKPIWREPLLRENLKEEGQTYQDAKRWLDASLDSRKKPPQPIVSGFFPILVGGQVIYRNYLEITAVDLKEKDIKWCSVELGGSLVSLQRQPRSAGALNTLLLGCRARGELSVLTDSSALGTLSSDGRRVYAVDVLVVLPTREERKQVKGSGLESLKPYLTGANLCAFDLASGKILWRLGDRWAFQEPVQKTFFLGPPLPLDGKLYALDEKDADIRLACLDPATGKLHWLEKLTVAREPVLFDRRRHAQAAHLAHADGVLVCPTNDGTVIGFDLARRKTLWTYKYRDKEPAPDGVLPMWRAFAPVLVGGKVFLTPPDSDWLYCLGLRDGKLAWKVKREGDLYLGGVHGGKILLVGNPACRALSAKDGKELWKVATGEPSGVGVLCGDRYHLPLRAGSESKQPEVCVLDLRTGRVVSRQAWGKDVPGNLLFAGGHVVSQSATEIRVYPAKLGANRP
jgi:RNA polymerase sigma factor (sigma-70 family)